MQKIFAIIAALTGYVLAVVLAMPAAAASPITHVVVIMEENHGYSQIIGSPSAPYINSLATTYGLATNYHAYGHYSADNYIEATSGTSCCFDDSYQSLGIASIFSQGESAATLKESPAAGRHDPQSYYSQASQTSDGTLQNPPDLSAAFTFVTPNLQNDMHDGSVQQGDSWLQSEIPRMLATPQYQAGNMAIFITWDEDSGGGQGATTPPNNQVATIVISPYTSHVADNTSFTHASLLRTTEDLLGLPCLADACSAPSMITAFGLSGGGTTTTTPTTTSSTSTGPGVPTPRPPHPYRPHRHACHSWFWPCHAPWAWRLVW